MMKKCFSILFFLPLLLAVSCHKSDDGKEPEPVPEPKEYETEPFTVKAVKTGGEDLNLTFLAGDVIEISNPQILFEPAVLVSENCAGQKEAVFSGELKVKPDAVLTSDMRLSAVLKNGENYNDGKPFSDVVELSSLSDADRYCYWSCGDFAYNQGGVNLSFEQSTVFVEFNIPFVGAKASLKYGMAYFSDVIAGNRFFAVPSGTSLEISNLDFKCDFSGKEKSFYKITASMPEGCLPALFSIGEDRQVFFSKGNLQYRPMDGAWRLAENQYYLKYPEDTYHYGENYANWMGEDRWTELFYWDAWVEGGRPDLISEDYRSLDFQMPIDENGNFNGVCAFGSEWTILTTDEWSYLLEKRPDALQKRGGAIVNGEEGFVVLPDNWTEPEGIKPFVAEFDVKYSSYIPNQYSEEEWSKMESAGAVFLRYCNELVGDLLHLSSYFLYLSKSCNVDVGCGYFIYFDPESSECQCYDLGFPNWYGGAVRLVQNLKPNVKAE